MKKVKILELFIALSVLAFGLSSCGAKLNDELYEATVGKEYDKTPPKNVTNLRAAESVKAVTLHWENPDDKDFYGVTISSIPASGTLEKPLTFIDDDISKIPTSINVTNLPGNVSYTFKVVTFDEKMNYSDGVNVTATPDGETGTNGGNFMGDGQVFSYKKTKSAFDFGYCTSSVTRTIEVTATSMVDMDETYISSQDRMGQGTFEIIDWSPKGKVNTGIQLSFSVKYTPKNPSEVKCWDEVDLVVGGDDNSKITLLGSNFKQPKNIVDGDSGVRLWLRADLIGSKDLENDMVKRIPDYSGNEFHAYCTDPSLIYAPKYSEKTTEFSNLPGIDFGGDNANSKKAQLLCMGTGIDPIVSSEKGTTTFVVLTPPSQITTNTSTILAANYGLSYPTLINTYRYYGPNGYGGSSIADTLHYGWAVKGAGLYGNYRYPCVSDSTTDPNNTWYTNSSLGDALSICMVFDGNKTVGYKDIEGNNGKNTRYDYSSNIRMQIDGKERLLSYIHSNTNTELKTDYSDSASTMSAECRGAYGKPISDGKGHRYGTLREEETPSTQNIANNSLSAIGKKVGSTIKNKEPALNEKTIYEKWIEARQESSERPYDWAYTYTPLDYIGVKTKDDATVEQDYFHKSNRSYSTYDDGISGYSGSSMYFANWISPEKRRNGIIYSMIIGVDSSIASSLITSKIAEVIMFDYALSDEEIRDVNNYIYYRYGIGSAN